jgi:hypothetical protein
MEPKLGQKFISNADYASKKLNHRHRVTLIAVILTAAIHTVTVLHSIRSLIHMLYLGFVNAVPVCEKQRRHRDPQKLVESDKVKLLLAVRSAASDLGAAKTIGAKCETPASPINTDSNHRITPWPCSQVVAIFTGGNVALLDELIGSERWPCTFNSFGHLFPFLKGGLDASLYRTISFMQKWKVLHKEEGQRWIDSVIIKLKLRLSSLESEP